MPEELDKKEKEFPTSTSGEPSVGTGQSSAFPTREEFKNLAEKQKSDQNILLVIMAGVVIFVVITFWIELSSMHRNYEQDKTILLQMNQQNSSYFDKVLFLNNFPQDQDKKK
jgi:hypothetical protein